VLTNWDVVPSHARRSYSTLLLKNSQSKAGLATFRNDSILKIEKKAPKKKKKRFTNRHKSVINEETKF
jgi:hypothetical protein